MKSNNWFTDAPRVQPSKTGAKLRAEKQERIKTDDEILFPLIGLLLPQRTSAREFFVNLPLKT